MWYKVYAKGVTAAVAALTILAAALADGQITAQEWVNVAVAGLSALGVVMVPNIPAE